jgi:penicillin-binding protein 1A
VSARVVVDIVTAPQSVRFLQEKYHISTVDPVNDANPAPMAVGAMSKGITTMEMAAAYATFGNGGKYYKPYAYYKVTDRNGREVFLENKPQGEQVINPATADVMGELLQTVKTTHYVKGRCPTISN